MTQERGRTHMAVVLIQVLDGVPPEMVSAVSKEMGVASDPPAGLIVHTASVVDGGVRIVDVWESEAAYRTFGEQRLGPAVAVVAERNGMTAPPAPPIDV